MRQVPATGGQGARATRVVIACEERLTIANPATLVLTPVIYVASAGGLVFAGLAFAKAAKYEPFSHCCSRIILFPTGCQLPNSEKRHFAFPVPASARKVRLQLRLSLADRHRQEMNPPVFVARFRQVRVGRVPSIGLLLLAASGGYALIGAARTCPAKTITVVVPFPADTSADVTAGQMAQRLSRELRQWVMVHKRPDVNGITGAKRIANAL